MGSKTKLDSARLIFGLWGFLRHVCELTVIAFLLCGCSHEDRAPNTPAINLNQPLPVETPKESGEKPDNPIAQMLYVYANKGGTNYHTADCEDLKNAATKMHLSEAYSQGLKTCPKCDPPYYGDNEETSGAL